MLERTRWINESTSTRLVLISSGCWLRFRFFKEKTLRKTAQLACQPNPCPMGVIGTYDWHKCPNWHVPPFVRQWISRAGPPYADQRMCRSLDTTGLSETPSNGNVSFWPYPWRIHGAAIYGNMDPINIPPMLAYIPYMDPMGYDQSRAKKEENW